MLTCVLGYLLILCYVMQELYFAGHRKTVPET